MHRLPELDGKDVAHPCWTIERGLVAMDGATFHVLAKVLAEARDSIEHDGTLLLLGLGILVSELLQLLLRLVQHHLDLRADAGHAGSDVVFEDCVKAAGQEDGALFHCNVRIAWVVGQKVSLRIQSLLHALLRVYVPLAPVDDADVAMQERVDPSFQNISRIRSVVHEIQLGQHPDRPLSVRVHLPCDLEPVRVRNVLVGGSDGEDDAVGTLDHLADHLADHF
mmetsp:Transcript_21421/g.50782  ORF Transcript_21421/g.50782 Transcript_21421/m.50782 type:complete len:223 (-) Transcript_21421:530-1198(-)